MGDRIVYTVKQDNDSYISLYSHWGGYERYQALAYALSKARPRWDDVSYGTRILFSNLIGPEWDSETGYGIWVGEDNGAGDHPSITIDFVDKTVSDETGEHSFDDFISYHGIQLTEIKL